MRAKKVRKKISKLPSKGHQKELLTLPPVWSSSFRTKKNVLMAARYFSCVRWRIKLTCIYVTLYSVESTQYLASGRCWILTECKLCRWISSVSLNLHVNFMKEMCQVCAHHANVLMYVRAESEFKSLYSKSLFLYLGRQFQKIICVNHIFTLKIL